MVRVLSFHASYRCQDAGTCCSAGWPIEAEADRADALRALGGERPGSGAWLLPVINRHCVFHDTARHRCRAHETLGHAALPLACRQFPRVSVIDPRGVSVTLSHFCPTARAMLEPAGSCAIISGAAGFPADGEYEGLDVRAALPPLLRPDMLMDWESWWLWEDESVALIAGRIDAPESALAALTVATASLRDWRPDRGPLSAAVHTAFAQARSSRNAGWQIDDATRQRWRQDVLAAIPAPHRPDFLEPAATPPGAPVLGRFLAAHAFANWTAHLGDGLHAWLRSLEVAYMLAAELGAGQADLLLRHLVNPKLLARRMALGKT